MNDFFHAVDAFWRQLSAVGWTALGIASGCHVLRLLLRTWAWRNILVAAFPGARPRWRSVAGAYFAGVGLNSILPARAGDALRAYLIKHRVEGSTYPTIASTLVVETLFDTLVAGSLLGWAIVAGELPGLNVLPDLPSIDWSWPLNHPRWAAILGSSLVTGLVLLGIWGARKVGEFRRRVAQGFAILRRPRRRYLRGVVFWQALSWTARLSAVFFFLKAFHVHASLHNALLVQVVLSLSTVIPFTPGGAGTQQGLLAFVFKHQRGLIVAFSVGMNIATTIINLTLGFASIGLMLRTLRWRKLLERDRDREPPLAGSQPMGEA